MNESLNNLAITSTNRLLTSAIGAMYNTLQSRLANGGRDRHCKFYYNNGAGGSILQVATKGVVGGVVTDIKDEAVKQFNSLFDKKKKTIELGNDWTTQIQKKHNEELSKYGMMQFDGKTIYALDEWGGRTTEGLMLAAKLDDDKKIKYKQEYYVYKTEKTGVNTYREVEPERKNNDVEISALVWYDTTALVTINSDKNFISTRVQGRDYSRKELVSNGDIKFSVTGQITSGKPDIYPTEEVAKFIKLMQYKGIIKVNNQILDQFGIDHIVITGFNMNPKQGYKSVQTYSFSGIGLQPEKENEITEDTVTIIKQRMVDTKQEDNSEWIKMLNSKLDGLKSMSKDLFSQGAGLATGMLEDVL